MRAADGLGCHAQLGCDFDEREVASGVGVLLNVVHDFAGLATACPGRSADYGRDRDVARIAADGLIALGISGRAISFQPA